MAFVFDMRRLHHGCGESLLVRPLKSVCITKTQHDNTRSGNPMMSAIGKRSRRDLTKPGTKRSGG